MLDVSVASLQIVLVHNIDATKPISERCNDFLIIPVEEVKKWFDRSLTRDVESNFECVMQRTANDSGSRIQESRSKTIAAIVSCNQSRM
jgi:hypothetical protein